MDTELSTLLDQVKKQGGMVLSRNGQPEAVVLSIDRYNSLATPQTTPEPNKKHVAILGAETSFGQKLLEFLTAKGYRIFALSDNNDSYMSELETQAEVLGLDFHSKDSFVQIINENKIELVIDVRTVTLLETGILSQDESLATLIPLLKALSLTKTPLCFSSRVIATESDQDPTKGLEAWVKILEEVLEHYANLGDFGLTILRHFELIIKNGGLGPLHLFDRIAEVIIGKKDFLEVSSNPETEIYDLIDLPSALAIYDEVITSQAQQIRKIDVASGAAVSLVDILGVVEDVLGKPVPTKPNFAIRQINHLANLDNQNIASQPRDLSSLVTSYFGN